MKLFMTLLAALLVVACSSHDLGQDCQSVGSTGQCADGTICGANNVDQLVCQKVCKLATDCASGEDCVVVTGTATRACRAR